LKRVHLLLALAVCALLLVATFFLRRLAPTYPDVGVEASGSFTPGGWYPGDELRHASAVRAWGSWSGSDENLGALRVGPFPAPRVLRFAIGGYPNNAGNTLRLELAETGEALPIAHPAVGERWDIATIDVPPTWVGRPIRIVALDESKILGGWLAVTEPLRGGRQRGNNALIESLAGWAITGLALGLLYFAALRWLPLTAWLPPHWVPLAAGAVVAACGYVAFWVYFAHPLCGTIFACTLLVVGFASACLRPPSVSTADLDISTVVKLTLAVGAFHLSLLHLFPTAYDFYSLAANRYRDALPGDNMLSHIVAERLFAGESPKNEIDEWRSSDRPPLQAGWQLLVWPLGKALDLDRRLVSGTAAVWFQLLWVGGLYGLLRTLGLAPRRAAGWTAVCALSGFFIQNTVFTWPKLSAGAFGCAAFALLAFPGAPAGRIARVVWGAALAALAWLSHGGVAFSFLALLPWVVWRLLRGEVRPWVPAAAVFLVLALPWLAYQRLYDPPGDRLLKWHLAGFQGKDDRTAWQAIRDKYGSTPTHEIWANKWSNLRLQFQGTARPLFDVSRATAAERRNNEFFHLRAGLTWWPLLAGLAFVLKRRRVLFGDGGALLSLGAWTLLTILVWCLLLFSPLQAVIHQGSYAMMIALFAFFSVAIDRAGPRWLGVLATLQAVSLATAWLPGNPVIDGRAAGLPFAILTGLVVLGFIVHGLRSPSPPLPEAKVQPGGRFATAWRTWWNEPTLNLGVLAAFALLLALRHPSALHTPQLWAEDGSIFLMQADYHGVSALAIPYMGYLHTIPRLIAAVASRLLDPAWWPAFYNGCAFAIWLAAVARLFSRRLDLPGKPWLALALFAVPHSGEVFFNVTNLQWLTALVLVQQALLAPPTSTAQRIGDLTIIALVALTGPFGILFAPLFAWRWWRERSPDNTLALAVLGICVAVQAWLVIRTGPRFDYQAQPFALYPNLVVLARRLFVWPLLGRDFALGLPHGAIATIGALGTVVVGWCTFRAGDRRPTRLVILGALLLILVAAVYRSRPDTWGMDNIDYGDRYFYIPRVLIAWLLISQLQASSRLLAVTTRLICVTALVVHLGNYILPAPKDYRWADHVEPVRRGVPANIPTLPDGWTLEYRGRSP
jgi:hypothetical protein